MKKVYQFFFGNTAKCFVNLLVTYTLALENQWIAAIPLLASVYYGWKVITNHTHS